MDIMDLRIEQTTGALIRELEEKNRELEDKLESVRAQLEELMPEEMR